MAENGDPHDFLARFLRGDLSEFFALEAGDTASALELPRDVDRPALVSALRRLALRLGAPAAVLANLDRLAHPASRVVVTGQQTVVEFTASQSGTFTFFCTVTCGGGHSTMRGTMTVQP